MTAIRKSYEESADPVGNARLQIWSFPRSYGRPSGFPDDGLPLPEISFYEGRTAYLRGRAQIEHCTSAVICGDLVGPPGLEPGTNGL